MLYVCSPRIKHLSRQHILVHCDDIGKSAQPLDVRSLHYVYVVKELIAKLYVEINTAVEC